MDIQVQSFMEDRFQGHILSGFNRLVSQDQWLRIDDQWYFFTPDGYKAAAEYWNGYWFNINGTWTYKARASWKKDSKGWYYQDTDGWYPRDCDVKINGKLYNFDAAGYCTNP